MSHRETEKTAEVSGSDLQPLSSLRPTARLYAALRPLPYLFSPVGPRRWSAGCDQGELV